MRTIRRLIYREVLGDEVLETNAEDFVKSYVQKGGE